MTASPRKERSDRESPGWEYHNPAISVGDPRNSHEVIGQDGQRRFFWIPGPHDKALALLAGWAKLPHGVTRDRGMIVLPGTARSAANVLSGVPAWSTEKDEVLKFMAGYANAAYGQFGAPDVSLSLDTVAISRGDVPSFIVPPHQVDPEPASAHLWLDGLVFDLRQVLVGDTRQDDLIQGFVGQLDPRILQGTPYDT